MTDSETPSSPGHERGLSRRTIQLLLGLVAVALAVLLCWAWWTRPTARVNRLLAGVGLGRLPPSAEHLIVDRQGRLSGHRRTFARFHASAEDIAHFVGAGTTSTDDPVPMRSIHFGPRTPSWMQWNTTVDGRMYHFKKPGASVWLAIDDGSHTVYLGVYASHPQWLERLFESVQGR